MNTEVGYTGGQNDNPTYHNHPGHAEAVEITYDPEKTSYKNILDFSFKSITQQHLTAKVTTEEPPTVRRYSMQMMKKKLLPKK